MDFRDWPRDMATRMDFRVWPRLYDIALLTFDVAEGAFYVVVLP